jgi:hypothetical protein
MEEINEIIYNVIENGTMQILEYEAISKGAERARVTKSRYTLEDQVVEVNTIYTHPVTHDSIYEILSQTKTII